MRKKEYSAATVKHSFWFSEFRKVVALLNNGKTFDDIKVLNADQNLFAAPTQARAIQIYNTVTNRVKSLDQTFYLMFEQSDVSTQKIIVLLSIMQTDSLFFDFVYEVYREKLIIGSNELSDSDIRIFFKDKQLQIEQVAKWTDYTLQRLSRSYKTFLMEAGVTDRAPGNRQILKPILDPKLEECMKENGMIVMIQTLTGVR
ncbi:DUF1819 family protein [Paenibacillus sp. N4]|uniref:DUF1819 family protein n=1 Tax=Paenibacillus vietnamensis TaxID=2590547 RepID=UPI001CD0B9BA|nr:DUF1819 family protein [Paenibacillus vietnamensis]MCA0757024.1 DUF1819 family protein [Paenibacillus vietnamensis]